MQIDLKETYKLDPVMPLDLSTFSSSPPPPSVHLLYNATMQARDTGCDVIFQDIRHVSRSGHPAKSLLVKQLVGSVLYCP